MSDMEGGDSGEGGMGGEGTSQSGSSETGGTLGGSSGSSSETGGTETAGNGVGGEPGFNATPGVGENQEGSWSMEGENRVQTFAGGTQFVTKPDGTQSLRIAIHADAPEATPESGPPSAKSGSISFVQGDGPLSLGGLGDNPNAFPGFRPLNPTASPGFRPLNPDVFPAFRPLNPDMGPSYKARCTERESQWVLNQAREAGILPWPEPTPEPTPEPSPTDGQPLPPPGKAWLQMRPLDNSVLNSTTASPFYHSSFKYDDGRDSGYYANGEVGKDKSPLASKYTNVGPPLDADLLRQAEAEIKPSFNRDFPDESTVPYDILLHNCHMYTSLVMFKYTMLLQQRESQNTPTNIPSLDPNALNDLIDGTRTHD